MCHLEVSEETHLGNKIGLVVIVNCKKMNSETQMALDVTFSKSRWHFVRWPPIFFLYFEEDWKSKRDV